MELKEGMYVRTKDGEIHKCLLIYIDNNNPTLNRFMNEWGNVITLDEIKGKPSFEIIDLIEVGDYVNGYKVVNIKIFSDGNKYVVIATEEHQSFWKDKVFEDEIKTIVTKEQFESDSYKVGE